MKIKQILIFSVVVTIWLVYKPSELKAQDYGLKAGAVFSTISGQESGSIKPGLQLGGL